ncbi:flagellar hook-basal body protein [Xenophilus sp.]|uniref:flagellar hook-basal body protein n=1 Tax=Xenophilus sp. TaxID=1873499 RepID=UPI0037DD91C9
MIDVLAVSLQGMQQDASRLERISANLANAMTPGYKSEIVSSLPSVGATLASSGTFAGAIQAQQHAQAGAPLPGSTEGAPRAQADIADGLLVRPDLRPGTLRATRRALDLALAGRGYLEVSTAQGTAYTRQGELQIDPRGRLVTLAGGHPVMGLGGEIMLSQPDPVIDAAGRVFERRADGAMDTAPVAQIKVVDAGDSAMRALGGGLLAALGEEPVELPETQVQLRQGYLENANVNTTHEMVQLIQTVRHFETLQKVASGYDEMLGAAVRRLGDLG